MPDPPIAARRPKELVKHGDVRIDDYYWLRDRSNPEVIAYLQAENAYTASVMAHTNGLQDRLFEEIKGRIKEDDSSAPYRFKDFFYYTRHEVGQSYPLLCRKRDTLEAPESIMLDVNALAKGHDYCQVSAAAVSHEQNLLAYTVDTRGRRIYTLRVRDLMAGVDLEDEVPEMTGNVVWANDNKTLFYSKQDPVTLRSFQVYRHVLGTPAGRDVLVYEEPDETFHVYVSKTKSREYIVIGSSQTLSDECRILRADKPLGTFSVFAPRERGHEYEIDHYGDAFYIRSNRDARNFKLMRTPESATGESDWVEIVPHREDTLLRGFELFRDAIVLEERHEGLTHLQVVPWDGKPHCLDFGEPAYLASTGTNPEADTQVLRYNYTSLTTPNSVYDYDMVTGERTLVKQEEVLGAFSPEDYLTERLWAPARDGARVPISIVYRKDFVKDGYSPLLLYGYGAYGISSNPGFSSPRLSLLNRGFAFAIAHVRGGQDLGRPWYEAGRQFHKMNTFTDFIDCAENLIREGYTSRERLFATGGSAGGLLMGAIVNMRPDLFAGIVTRVPFVDVLTTMLDPDIPLTTSEYDEWGNPNEREAYEYIRRYSPYDNVEMKDYPHLLVTTGLHDSQVQYWEPAKWVAKLRATRTDTHRLLLKTDMEAGHSGASGRYERYRETALNYAFLLDLAGVRQ